MRANLSYFFTLAISLSISCTEPAGLSENSPSDADTPPEEALGDEFKILSSIPKDGSTDIAEETVISMLFSKPASLESISVNSFDTSCLGSIQLSSDDFKTCVKMKDNVLTAKDNTQFSF